MGWDQKDAVGESLQGGDRVKVFRHNGKRGQEVVGEYVGRVVKVIAVESDDYEGFLQICLDFGAGRRGWVHQSSVMKV